MSTLWPFPLKTASQEKIDLARKHGTLIDGRDGNFVIRGYQFNGKVYICAFDEEI